MTRWYLLLISACIAAPLALAQQIKRPSQSASANTSTKQDTTEPPSTFPASAALSIQSSLESIAAAQVAQTQSGKPSEDSQREKDDLKAQQDMAFWAQAMFFATLVSAAVSVGATWLLFLTLKQSRRATFAALRAAVAGRQSVQLTRENSQKELRAYLTVKSLMWEGAPINKWRILIPNAGQTPAYKVSAKLYWQPVSYGERLPDDFKFPDQDTNRPRHESLQTIGGNQSGHSDFDIDPLSIHSAIQHASCLFIYGRVEYFDIFSRKRTTQFCYEFIPQAHGIILHMTKRHNDAD